MLSEKECLIEDSMCWVVGDKEGRLSFDGQKVTFGFHIAAKLRFGDRMLAVDANKKQSSLVVSHVCGTRRCCVADHLVLETKQKNDERTACHRVMRTVFKKSGRAGLAKLHELPFCEHIPRCGTLA